MAGRAAALETQGAAWGDTEINLRPLFSAGVFRQGILF